MILIRVKLSSDDRNSSILIIQPTAMFEIMYKWIGTNLIGNDIDGTTHVWEPSPESMKDERWKTESVRSVLLRWSGNDARTAQLLRLVSDRHNAYVDVNTIYTAWSRDARRMIRGQRISHRVGRECGSRGTNGGLELHARRTHGSTTRWGRAKGQRVLTRLHTANPGNKRVANVYKRAVRTTRRHFWSNGRGIGEQPNQGVGRIWLGIYRTVDGERLLATLLQCSVHAHGRITDKWTRRELERREIPTRGRSIIVDCSSVCVKTLSH